MTACEICGGGNARLLVSIEGFHIGKCTRCGLIYVTNPLDESELPELYSKQYFFELETTEYSPDSRDLNMKRHFSYNQQRLHALERFAKTGRLLDVGCGPGLFLVSARKRSWKVTGVDISEKAARFARSKFGLDVISGAIEQANLSEGAFDVITMWHLLEHTSHPLGTLRTAKKLLNADGMLLIEVPNVNSLSAKIRRKRFAESARPIYHRYYFSLTSLARLARLAGFDVLQRLDYDYRESDDAKSGLKKMMKEPLHAANLDSSLSILARLARRPHSSS
jgi:SAM-dependent methyltransferase